MWLGHWAGGETPAIRRAYAECVGRLGKDSWIVAAQGRLAITPRPRWARGRSTRGRPRCARCNVGAEQANRGQRMSIERLTPTDHRSSLAGAVVLPRVVVFTICQIILLAGQAFTGSPAATAEFLHVYVSASPYSVDVSTGSAYVDLTITIDSSVVFLIRRSGSAPTPRRLVRDRGTYSTAVARRTMASIAVGSTVAFDDERPLGRGHPHLRAR